MEQRRKSFRLRFAFQLDDMRQDESELIDYIQELKTQRKFVTTIKQGLRLIRDLRAGRSDVLLSLFPHVVENLRGQTDNTELLNLIASMMHKPGATSFTPPNLPTFETAPTVGKVDETKARELSVQNALAALDDF